MTVFRQRDKAREDLRLARREMALARSIMTPEQLSDLETMLSDEREGQS